MLTRFSTGIVKGVSVVSKGQDRLAGNIRQDISEFATVAGALAPENVMKNDDFHKAIIMTKGELAPPPPVFPDNR
jgi:hypothetical protein